MQQSRSTGNLNRVHSECSASPSNRIKILANNVPRKSIVSELKKMIREHPNVEISNKMVDLVQQLYLDAEYRERTSLKLKDIVVNLENKIVGL